MSAQLFNNKNNKNNLENTPRVVINATKIAVDDIAAEIYEFVLDSSLQVTACGYVTSISEGKTDLIDNFDEVIQDSLFEINHVRVNPQLDNSLILDKLKQQLLDSGVNIIDPPEEILMAICYKPIGELQDIVRFYHNSDANQLVFLAHKAKLSLVKPH